jgi:hypothetical protein
MDQQNVGSNRSASSTSNRVAAKSLEGANQVKDTVVEQANQLRDRALSAKEHTGDRIRGVATQLRGMSETFREDDPLIANVAERASQGVESVARYVSSATPQSVIRDTERLARRQPALFFGGAFLLGLAAGRFMRSSSPEGERGPANSGGRGERQQGWSNTERQDRASGFFSSSERSGTPRTGDDDLDRPFGSEGAQEYEVSRRPSSDDESEAPITLGALSSSPGSAPGKRNGTRSTSPRKGDDS